MGAKRNTLSVRFNFDGRLDILKDITSSLIAKGLPGVESAVHLPLAMSTGEGPSDDEVDALVAKLSADLERIASTLEPFTVSFCGTGCFYSCGGNPDDNVIFLTPYLPTEVRAAHGAIYAALQEAAAPSGVLVSHYSHPDNWQPHVTIASRVKRDSFTAVVHMVHEWAQRAPVFKQWVGAGVLHSERKDSDALTPTRQKTGCYPVEVRCIGFKMNNYKGTGEAKQWTFELRGDGASAEAEPGRRRRIPWGPAGAGVGAALCLGALVVLRSRR